MRMRYFLAAALLASGGASAQVYKCPDAAGRTVLQQTPCAGGSQVTVRPASGHSDAVASGHAQARLDKLKADNTMAEAVREGRPLEGMTTAQLNQAMGLATKVNTDMVNGVRHEQVIFERPDATWSVYTRNGVVTSYQHRRGAPAGQRQRPPCPTAHELRDAEVSASSLNATPSQKERARVLNEALQNCRR